MRLTDLNKTIVEKSKQSLLEGVRFGQRELNATLENISKFQMGIEYELLPPEGTYEEDRVDDAQEFVDSNNIPAIESIVDEHDHMVEIITDIMDVPQGLKHIKRVIELAEDASYRFPPFAGMHVSISMKDSSLDVNHIKLLTLLSGDYLDSIFPARTHTGNFQKVMRKELRNNYDSDEFSVEEVENILNSSIELDDKYSAVNFGDYFDSHGRIELRFLGGEGYNKRYDEIRWQIIRAVFILGIAYDENMYRNEYHKMLYRIWEESRDRVRELVAMIDDAHSRSSDIPVRHLATTIKGKNNTIDQRVKDIFMDRLPKVNENTAFSMVRALLTLNLSKRESMFVQKVVKRFLDDHAHIHYLFPIYTATMPEHPSIGKLVREKLVDIFKEDGIRAFDINLLNELGRVDEIEDLLMNELADDVDGDAPVKAFHYTYLMHKQHPELIDELLIPLIEKDDDSTVSFLVALPTIIQNMVRSNDGIVFLKKMIDNDKSGDALTRGIIMSVSRTQIGSKAMFDRDISQYRDLFTEQGYYRILSTFVLFDVAEANDTIEEVTNQLDLIEEIISAGVDLESGLTAILENNPALYEGRPIIAKYIEEKK